MLKDHTTSRAVSRTLLFCLPDLQIPRIHIQRAPGNNCAPGCLPQNFAFCTGRVSIEAAGDVQLSIPTPNTRCWAQSQCTSSAYSLLLARCNLGDWVSKLLIHFINDLCSNPKRQLWSPSPERDQGWSPVPSAHPGGAGTPGSSHQCQ